MENKKELATVNTKTVDIEMIKKYLDVQGLAKKLTNEQKEMFINIAISFGLNPFKREIYAITYGSVPQFITGFEVYLKRAERTGKLDGWKVEASGNVNDNSLCAKITIWRKDWKMPFEHTVFYSECNGVSGIWKKMPIYMTKKVAMSQGFRLCFSDELGGMPYTSDEIATEVENVELINDEATQASSSHSLENKAELEPLKKELNSYAHLFTGDNKKALEAIFTANNIDRMKKALNWAKNEDKKRAAEVEAEATELY